MSKQQIDLETCALGTVVWLRGGQRGILVEKKTLSSELDPYRFKIQITSGETDLLLWYTRTGVRNLEMSSQEWPDDIVAILTDDSTKEKVPAPAKAISDAEILRRAGAIKELESLQNAEISPDARLSSIPLNGRKGAVPVAHILDRMNKTIAATCQTALDEHRKYLRAIADGQHSLNA